MPITIRAAHEWDAHRVLECLHEVFAPYREHYTADAFRDTVLDHESIVNRMRDMTIFIAIDDDGEVAGTIACGHAAHAEAHVRGMAVRPRWQGLGVADELLTTAEDHARSMSCRRITLDTTEPLRRAMRFYERHGYARTGVVTEFFGMRLHEFAKDL